MLIIDTDNIAIGPFSLGQAALYLSSLLGITVTPESAADVARAEGYEVRLTSDERGA